MMQDTNEKNDIREMKREETKQIDQLKENYVLLQENMKQKLDLVNRVQVDKCQLIAGVDLAYWQEEGKEYANCCIVIIDRETKKVIERKWQIGKIEVPYIPGCLAFREIPLVMKTVEQLKSNPDLYIFDGNGYLHPRHMGLAAHAGILLNKPTIGIAKSYYKIDNVDYEEPAHETFAYSDIIIKGEVYGRAVRTQKNVKPLFLSVGKQIDLQTAMEVTKMLVTSESHIPMPTRLADLMTHEIRRNYKNGEFESIQNINHDTARI